MGIAERRHHRERLKSRRKHYWYGDDKDLTDKHLGMLVNTTKPCSCWMCRNPRRALKGKDKVTMQELKATDIQNEPS